MEDNHSTEQIVAELGLKLVSRLTAWINSNVAERNTARLINLFQTINERPPLNRNPPGVIGDAWIRFNNLGHDVHLKLYDISR